MGRKKIEKVYTVEDLNKKIDKEFRECRKLLNAIKKRYEVLADKHHELMQNTLNSLQKILKTHEESELTQRNMLLAIKQNDYLCAYYPEQRGYPAGKYIGPHPIKKEELDKKYAHRITR